MFKIFLANIDLIELFVPRVLENSVYNRTRTRPPQIRFKKVYNQKKGSGIAKDGPPKRAVQRKIEPERAT